MRKPVSLCMTISFGLVLALFHIKYKVRDLQQELRLVHQGIFEEQENYHLLKAEWSYLNSPKRVAALAKKHLPNLNGVSTFKLAQFHHEASPSSPPRPHLKTVKKQR